MKNIVELIEESPNLYVLKGISNQEIIDAEKELNLSFSNEYKSYLKEFGVASFDGHEWTGICKSNRLNVVHVTNLEMMRNSLVPKEFYVIEQTNIDDVVIWQNKEGEVYQSTSISNSLKIANSLVDYLNNILRK